MPALTRPLRPLILAAALVMIPGLLQAQVSERLRHKDRATALTEVEISMIRDWYAGARAPKPLPSGQLRRLEVGKPLPRGIVRTRLDPQLAGKLPPREATSVVVLLGNRIGLVDAAGILLELVDLIRR